MSKYNYEQNANDYLTPPELIEIVLSSYNRAFFDLDTCCNQTNIPAIYHYKASEIDGLKSPWKKFNWCNPPFDNCDRWVKKAYEEKIKGNSTIMLIPARTETKYWAKYILDENGGTNRKDVKVQFLKKGLCFIDAKTNQKMGIFKNALALIHFRGNK